MQDHKKQDSLYVNTITANNDVKAVTDKPTGNAGRDPFCVYDHKRHAVGSKLKYHDGSESVCTEDSTWQNK